MRAVLRMYSKGIIVLLSWIMKKIGIDYAYR